MSTTTDTMRAIEIVAPGGPEVLRPVRRPVPKPGATQVLIEVEYAGVNRHDCGQRERGSPPPGATDIPGLEVSGRIAAVGSEVRWRVPGERVCALVNGGGYAEYCVAEDVLALPFPEGFDALQSAAIPETLFTTWQNVYRIARLAKDDWLLVHGGSSGIGTTAIQLALLTGARPIVTAGSDAKCAACVRLGAIEAINYRTQDFVAEVKRVTGGHGADVIFDMVGAEYAVRNLETLAPDGRLVHIAGLRGGNFSVPLRDLMAKRAMVSGSMLRPLPLEQKREIADVMRSQIWPAMGKRIRPVIDSTFPLERACDAHARMESSVHIGKIMLQIAVG
jgi:putative PIG3 family NAD(P)H quinone oxidoreductase